ncbi:uncharacterized protein G2W53_027510 [Senna tora]|uniref:Uncharacterized protein n=1 Tax=Senna tora TaxID=362788 RepID=A0A834TJE3_9FABA|nr:uncharacterized protein G2W53_027510 [Senna tora]
MVLEKYGHLQILTKNQSTNHSVIQQDIVFLHQAEEHSAQALIKRR